MNRRDCGFILPMTIVTLTLLALAALMTGRAVGAMLRASVQERLTIAEQQTTRTAEAVLDAWMADKLISLQITDPSQPHHALILDRDAWRTSEGIQPCPTAKETSCWRILLPPPPLTPTTTVKLRGGEAERRIREVTIETRSGCFSSIDNCQRTHTVTREYERAVFAQYQLHFNKHDAPQRAIDHASDSLTAAEAAARAANPGTPSNQLAALVAADADVIEWTSRVTLLQGARIVFADGDTFDGPVRTGLNRVLICGSPIFHKPVEVSLPEGTDTTGIVVQAPGCTNLSLPNWKGQPFSGRVVAGGSLDLPADDVFPLSEACRIAAVDYDHPNDRNNPLLGDCASGGRIIADGDLIAPPAGNRDITITKLVVEGSVTVYAPGDIIVQGDIEATGTNPAGGQNVVALIAGGNIILDPCDSNNSPPLCASDVQVPCLNPVTHDLTLTNVAVLARTGAMFAPAWHMNPCDPTDPPTLTFDGSLAAEHLGIYGQLEDTGFHLSGWKKAFAYPADFWQARPPWWPGFTSSEWAPVGTPTASTDATAPEPQPGLMVNPATVTVTEGSTTTTSFNVSLATQPSADVTVNVRLRPSPILLVTPSTMAFTPDNWDTAQNVTVNAMNYQDADNIDTIFEVALTATSTDTDYNAKAASVRVTVRDDDSAGLMVSATLLTVPEGSTGTFDVELATQPTQQVTVTLATDDTTVATVTPASLTFTTSNWDTAQTVTVTGAQDDDTNDETTTAILTASGGDYSRQTATVAVTVTDDDTPVLLSRFTAADAAAYVTARDALVDESKNGASFLFGTSQYVRNYLDGASYYRSRNGLDPDIPLGENEDPNSLPDPTTPQGQEDLRDAIDALAVAAGLLQSMIDAAEGG